MAPWAETLWWRGEGFVWLSKAGGLGDTYVQPQAAGRMSLAHRSNPTPRHPTGASLYLGCPWFLGSQTWGGEAARWGELEGLLLQLYSGLSGLLRTPSYRGSPSGVRVVSSDVQNEREMVKKQEMAQGLMHTL